MEQSRYIIVERWFDYLFTEQPLDSALRELSEWGRYLDLVDQEEVRVRAVPHVRRALPADAPTGSAEHLVDAVLAPAEEEALALATL
jgi:hypothetical protein